MATRRSLATPHGLHGELEWCRAVSHPSKHDMTASLLAAGTDRLVRTCVCSQYGTSCAACCVSPWAMHPQEAHIPSRQLSVGSLQPPSETVTPRRSSVDRQAQRSSSFALVGQVSPPASPAHAMPLRRQFPSALLFSFSAFGCCQVCSTALWGAAPGPKRRCGARFGCLPSSPPQTTEYLGVPVCLRALHCSLDGMLGRLPSLVPIVAGMPWTDAGSGAGSMVSALLHRATERPAAERPGTHCSIHRSFPAYTA